tara:strand:- start:1801 stop:3045 length:1245 start_codon:yes stop_codon:yes gene_type:complete
MNSLRIGICGWGNVATGLYKAINSNSEQIKSAGNTNIDIVVIGARRDNPKCDPKETKIERDIFDVLDHDIDVMVELIGGVEVARELILASICKGIHVVTANKAVLYHHGDEIFTKAKEKNVHVLYESSVCAGTPIIKMLNEELAGNKISKISGMLNGTSNFILSQMENGADFDPTLKFAQEKGYAEPDPSFDIEGMDAAHKIGILSSIAIGTSLPPNDFYVEGIKDIDSTDFKYASKLGFSIKHLAVASLTENEVQLRAHPVLVSSDSYLAGLKGVRNGIEVETDLVGTLHVAGSGVGQESTASGLISDLVYLSNVSSNSSINLNKRIKMNIQPIDEMEFKYFFKIKTLSKDMNLNKIEKIFQKNQVSISAENFDDFYIIIISESFIENKKDSIMVSLNNLSEVASVKSIRIEP